MVSPNLPGEMSLDQEKLAEELMRYVNWRAEQCGDIREQQLTYYLKHIRAGLHGFCGIGWHPDGELLDIRSPDLFLKWKLAGKPTAAASRKKSQRGTRRKLRAASPRTENRRTKE